MQVEAILSNSNITKDKQVNNANVNTLFSSENKVTIKDRLLIGLDSVESFEAIYSNNAMIEDVKETEIKTNSLKLSQDSLNQFINSVTPEDFDKYEELGIIPDKEDPGNLLTVTERIKIELMTHCKDYKNVGTSVNKADIEECASSIGMAYSIENKLKENNLPVTDENIEEVKSAYQTAREITEINKGTEGYLLKNKLQPSINNVYIAEHSSNTTGITKKSLTQSEWESIKPQVEKMMQEVGFEGSSKNLESAKEIIEQNVPLTVDSMSNMQQIKNIDLTLSEEPLLTQIVTTMASGKQAKDTILTNQQGFIERAQNAIEVLKTADDVQLTNIVANNQQVTIANLNKEYTNNVEVSTSINIIEAKKQLEEIRLQMTLEAGVKMLNKGIPIEVEPLKNIIKELENEQQEYYKALYASVDYEPTNEDITSLQSVLESADRLKSIPNYIIGSVVNKETDFTIQATDANGLALKGKLDAASISYETLSTTIRTDLGDSINKAFDSIGGILEDLELEDTQSNQRAVRILSYNQMEINQENIAQVKQVTQEYTRLTENLKPKVTAYLIANKINPLTTSINQLNDTIDQVNEEIGETREEKYSEFLWKLDKEEALSEEEREAFIGIYRLLNMVQKGDYAAIGSLVNQGAPVTLKNLATAVKSKKAENLDVTVDNNFGERVNTDTKESINLLSQLSWFQSRFTEQVTKNVTQMVTPSKLKDIVGTNDIQNLSMEKLEEELYANAQNESEINRQYKEQKIKSMNEVNQVSDEAIQVLFDNQQKVSPQNIIAAGYLLKSKKGLFESLSEELEIEDSLKIEEGFLDAESAQNKYTQLQEKVASAIENKLENNDIQTLDLSKLKLIHNAVTLMKNMSQKNTYHIPIEVSGEACTIRLKVISNSEESGKISIELDSEALGKTSTEFKVENHSLKGIILTDNKKTSEYIKENLKSFADKLDGLGIEINNIDCCVHNNIKMGMWSKQNVEEKPTTKELYQIAKNYIKTLKEWATDIN